MAWSSDPKRHMNSQFILAGVLFVVLMAVGVSVYAFTQSRQPAEELETRTIAQEQPELISAQDTPEPEPEPALYDIAPIQQVLDTWGAAQSGSASVVVKKVGEEPVAMINADQQYFTASIYKLYVAYAGYQQLDAGRVNPDEIYSGDKTRVQCLDEMIRTSDSPCAEKLWAELGKQDLTDQLVGYGLTNTSMSALNTSAADAAIMLELITLGQGLSDESQQAMLASMEQQVYRDALNKGFSSAVTVYNKIGFNGLAEYHDTAFIQTETGDQFVVSVLTDGVGTTQIAELARQLEPVFAVAKDI